MSDKKRDIAPRAQDKIVALKATEIKDLIKQRYRNRHIRTRPLCIIGHKGMGKTEITRQTAEELSAELGLDIKCFTTNLQFKDPPDFIGLPYRFTDKSGKERTTHAVPFGIPNTDEHVIWFFDEANRCNRDNRSALLTILQDRRIEDHYFGPNVLMVLAMNPSEADGVSYEVQEWDSALKDRVAEVWFKGDVDETLKFMKDKHGVSHPVVSWIKDTPEVIDYFGQLRTSPRGLDALASAITANGGMEVANIFSVIAAEIGMEGAHSFMKYLNDVENIKASDILNSFTTDDVLRGKLETLEANGRNDILSSVLKSVCRLIAESVTTNNSKTTLTLSCDQVNNLIAYLEYLPADMKQVFFLESGELLTADKSAAFTDLVTLLIAKSKVIEKFLDSTPAK